MAVYVIATKCKKYAKIGYTSSWTSVFERLRSLQCGCPLELFVYNFYESMTQQDERNLHKILEPSRTKGGREWFTAKHAIHAIEQYAKQHEHKVSEVAKRVSGWGSKAASKNLMELGLLELGININQGAVSPNARTRFTLNGDDYCPVTKRRVSSTLKRLGYAYPLDSSQFYSESSAKKPSKINDERKILTFEQIVSLMLRPFKSTVNYKASLVVAEHVAESLLTSRGIQSETQVYFSGRTAFIESTDSGRVFDLTTLTKTAEEYWHFLKPYALKVIHEFRQGYGGEYVHSYAFYEDGLLTKSRDWSRHT